MIFGSEQLQNNDPLTFVEKVALATSTTIEAAELNGRLDGDHSLCFILEAMQRNNHSKVRALKLQNCQLTDASAQTLIEFVINSKRITHVELQGNRISPNNLTMLHNAIELNRVLHFNGYLPAFRELKFSKKPTIDLTLNPFTARQPLIQRR